MEKERCFLFIIYRTKDIYSSPKERNTGLKLSGKVFDHMLYLLLFFQRFKILFFERKIYLGEKIMVREKYTKSYHKENL